MDKCDGSVHRVLIARQYMLTFIICRSATDLHSIDSKKKGTIMVAINEWLTFYNVRVNQINLMTGREMLVKVKPTQHTASERVKALSIESRKCRLPTENHVRILLIIVNLHFH